MNTSFNRWLKDDAGQAISEYGLLLALVGVAVVGTVVAASIGSGGAATDVTINNAAAASCDIAGGSNTGVYWIAIGPRA